MAQATHKNTRAAAEQKAHRQPKTDKPRRAAKPPREEHVQKESVQPKRARPARATKDKGRIRVIPLGGLQEIGKNLTVIEYENDMIAVDCGLAFPEEDMLGVDLVIPDITYLEQNADRLRGIFLTHGHEDHIGALPYVLRSIQPPIFGTKLTLGIIKNKLKEHSLPFAPDLRTVSAGDTIRAGAMSVEFIRVNHSIADACALAIHTPLGTLVHTGDYKLDLTPIQGEMMNITKTSDVHHLALHGGEVQLRVARVHQGADRRVDRKRTGVCDRVIDA
ncbi:MAG: ribonuclease J, partial [Clostridia bacterium]|nr:ribonuclease J [Clostridia bacterium]